MLKRLFWLVVGFVLGLGSSLAIVSKLRRLAARYAPPKIARRLGERATSATRDVRAAVRDGRSEMRTREADMMARIDERGRVR